jgi:peptidoglycan/LPS O-acetylase OafA/YrhL
MNQQSTNRNLGIDFVRGMSILFVVLLHLNLRLKLEESIFIEVLPKKLFKAIFWSGFDGVVIFFTLSGFLITSTIFKRWQNLSTINLKEFYWLRFSRIIPTLVLLLSVLSIFHLLNIDGFAIDKEKTTLVQVVFSALTFHLNLLELKVGFLPGPWDVLWTISIEEVFYIVLPIVCLFIRNKWILLILFISTLILSPYSRVNFLSESNLVDKNNLNYLDSIAMGVFTAFLVKNFNFSQIVKTISGLLGGLLIFIVIFFRGKLYKYGITDLGLDLSILSMGVGLLVFWMNYHFENKTIVYFPLNLICNMGKYSYEIYLTHMIIVVFASKIFLSNNLSNNTKPIIIVLSLILCWILGKLVFDYYSNPINQKLRNWAKSKF